MGYLRARRSIKLGAGVKLNLNKRSVGLTVGGRGAHYSVNSRGTRTRTVGIPGTGLSYIDRSGGTSSRRTATRTSARSVQGTFQQPQPAHPSLFARHYERAFYHGIQKMSAGEVEAALSNFRDADDSDDKHRAISPALFVGALNFQLGSKADAIPYLERVTRSAQALPDKLLAKYDNDFHIELLLRGRIPIRLPLNSAGATVLLAECYRADGRVLEAIGLMQKIHDEYPEPTTLLFLCTQYRAAEEWDEIVHATAGTTNDDDLTLQICLWQAEAMEKQDLPDAALEVYREALKSKKRDVELLKEARYGRANLCVGMGKRAMAKRDLGRLYTEDPDYEKVGALLRTLG